MLCLLIGLAVAVTTAAECQSSNPGDATTPMCEPWCSVQDKTHDCNFCFCRACTFCGGGGKGSGNSDKKAAKRAEKETSWDIPHEACSLQANLTRDSCSAAKFLCDVIFPIRLYTPRLPHGTRRI